MWPLLLEENRIFGSNVHACHFKHVVGERRAIKQLGDDESILILSADKGRATVVMVRQNYECKIRLLLEDSNTHKKLPKDPSQCLERKMNAMLLELGKKGSLSEQLYIRLRSSAGCTPLLYALPKIHKPDIPLRPIASFVQSPSYQLSRHLAHILSPLVGNTDSHVTNSSEFAFFIQEVRKPSRRRRPGVI